ncbi:hypothetical protein PINS_up017259 [Pythium insidiosum]|nr:hypothetical protein PINS_up017259 [Pythium insidiosum]
MLTRLPEPDAEAEPDESASSNPDDPDVSATSGGSGNLKPRRDPLEGLEYVGRPQRKNISLASYTGGSDVYTFVEVFRFQLETAQILEGKRYTPEPSRTLFVACLDGDPAIVIHDFILRNRNATLDETTTCLLQRYSSRLTTTATLDQIRSQKKAPSETYLQFATRLKEMAKSLPGALENVTNADVVLEEVAAAVVPAGEPEDEAAADREDVAVAADAVSKADRTTRLPNQLHRTHHATMPQ